LHVPPSSSIVFSAYPYSLFFCCSVDHPVLHSFPTRRSSDLAGMEGALPSVVGGMVGVPIIAVPTSVGYGSSFGGITAKRTSIAQDRKSTRLNSSHQIISYAVFCLKKKKKRKN